MILMPEACTMCVTFLLGCMRDQKRDKATQLCELKNLAHHYEKGKKKDKSTAGASQERATFTST